MTRPDGDRDGQASSSAFRPDIEGLRAVAVLLVMAYHAGLPIRAGFLGVDVFFVLSGFLITGLLVRELGERGTISWPAFLARLARRLLPAAILVLVVTATVGWFVVPGRRLADLGHDVVSAAVYVVNWTLANRAVDYLASDAVPSAVQHYWSLAVEEQYYVLWPLLLIVATLLGRRLLPGHFDRGGGPRLGLVGGLLLVISVPSFAWSLWLTAQDPARAYFVTTTRAWELAIGAGLAIWGTSRLERSLSLLPIRYAGWLAAVGLVALLGAALLITPRTAWPGWLAAIPTVGTAGVVLSGWAVPANTVSRVLGWRPLVWLGGLSYSIYLWHWPVLVLGQWALRDFTTGWMKVLLVAGSLLPAWASHRWLEQPIHRASGWARGLGRNARPALVMGLALSLTGVAAGSLLLQWRSPFVTTPASGVRPDVSELGANTLPLGSSADAALPEPGDWVTPDPLDAGLDRPKADVDHCQVDREAVEPVVCTFGDPAGTTTVALVGDSKAMQWLPALEVGARERHWKVLTVGKSSCAFAAHPAALWGEPYVECDEWNARVMKLLPGLRPDVVVTSANGGITLAPGDSRTDVLATAFAERWNELAAHGIPVVAIGNSPRSPNDLDVCAADHVRDLGACAFDKAGAIRGLGRQAMFLASERVKGSTFIDLTPVICPGTTCPLVIGHVVVHRAGDHITATFAATAADRINPEIDKVLARAALHPPS